MEFLKEILGEELFKQVTEKINDHNGNEANKDKQVKLGNLAAGEYIGKMEHDSEIEKLQNLLSGKETELTTATELVEEFKKGTKGNEDLQGKIKAYEADIETLQKQLQETRLSAAIKVALLSEKAVDTDYLTFKLNEKLKEKGETLELDDNGNIKGWEERVSGLKTQFPTMFETGEKGGYKVLGDNRLPGGDEGRKSEPKSLAEALKDKFENPTE